MNDMTSMRARQADLRMPGFAALTYATLGIAAAFFCGLLCGCGDSVDADVLAMRNKLVLTQMPADEQSVSRIRAALSEDGVGSVDVVIRGRIHAGDLPPWEDGKAAFVLTDATGHEGEEDHDPHTCPFCSRNINDYLAMVVFSDSGTDINIDSRELFEVKEKQLVLVRGKAKIGGDDLLQVDANGIYIVP